jgi:hypothetical protein
VHKQAGHYAPSSHGHMFLPHTYSPNDWVRMWFRKGAGWNATCRTMHSLSVAICVKAGFFPRSFMHIRSRLACFMPRVFGARAVDAMCCSRRGLGVSWCNHGDPPQVLRDGGYSWTEPAWLGRDPDPVCFFFDCV